MISRRSVLGATAGAVAISGLGMTTRAAGSGVNWSQLRSHMTGTLVLPGDPGYTTAKQLDLQQFDVINPQAIAYCAGTSDVALTLRFAQDNGLPFAVRSGGHSGGGYSTTTGLVIDVSRLNSVTVSGSKAIFGTGAENVDITNGLAAYGFAVPGGYCPTVAAGGFVQGGGLGLLSRPYGMACDNVTAVRVVLASGQTVTASATQYRDLFWAIRGGGGGNFGVVTSYEVAPAAVTSVGLINLVWDWSQAPAMLEGYAQWSLDAPRTISGGAFIQLPDAAAGNVPTPMAFVGSTGTTTELESEVSRLIALTGAPVQQSPTSVVPYSQLMMNFYRCASDTVTQCHRSDNYPGGVLTRPAFGLQRSRMFKNLPSTALWENLCGLFEQYRVAGQGHILEVLPMGGAIADLSRTDTAFVHRDQLMTINVLCDIEDPTYADANGKAAGQGFVDAGFDALDPESSGETYQNFIDPELPDWRSSYYAENYSRLAWIKSKYDPYNAFSFQQSIL